MPTSRRLRAAGLALLLAALGARQGLGQDSTPIKALELEQAGKLKEAAAAYRQSLTESTLTQAILGLERVYSLLGRSDSILPLVDSLLRQRPRDPLIHTIQLRTLTSLQRDVDARMAFERWLQFVPRDATPYREYARQLLDNGRSAAADTVLQRAQKALGTTRDISAELAQLRAAMGLWTPSAKSWREATRTSPYLEQAAVFSLLQAPATVRDSIRMTFTEPPTEIAARKILALLELRWRSPREGWAALRDLPPTDSAVAAWSDFAEQAEDAEAWLTARDALAAALRARPSEKLALRAATDALGGGDAQSALDILARVQAPSDSVRAQTILPLEVRALSTLGRAEEAEARVAKVNAYLDADLRARLARVIALGWVRAGNLPRARAALAQAGGDDDDQTTGLLALYAGDLGEARKKLRRVLAPTGDLVLAMSLLSRTRAESAPAIGAAFLALARGDSLDAATKFAAATTEADDAAPLLLAAAARVYTARRDDAHSVPLWTRVVEQYAAAPEAAEAELEWAKALRRGGDASEAIKHLEHMILTYPQSALVPQARRELELARNAVPTLES